MKIIYCSLTKQYRAGTTSKMCHFYEVVFQETWILRVARSVFGLICFQNTRVATEGSIRARQGNKLTVLADGVLRKAVFHQETLVGLLYFSTHFR